jgi:tetratricopeptide (TPR) repeat protein
MEEAEKKMRDMEASHRARTTKLQQELALVRGELTEHQSRYAELLKKSQANEIRLKQRIKELEQAFALPSTGESESSEQAKTVIPEESAAVVPAADVKISARYQAIIDMTVRDKSRALKQYEKLPADTQKPIALLKAIANVYRDKKNYEKAYAMYEEVLQRNPGDLYAERKLVMTLFDLGRYDEALARLSGSSNGATGDVKRGDSQPEESQK